MSDFFPALDALRNECDATEYAELCGLALIAAADFLRTGDPMPASLVAELVTVRDDETLSPQLRDEASALLATYRQAN